MSIATRRGFLTAGLIGAACACAAIGAAHAADAPPNAQKGGKWICPPCGCAADGKEFDAPGACPECGMPLIRKEAPKADAPPAPKA
jgi:rubrerythrin